jgi:nitrile hydratase accessory protein
MNARDLVVDERGVAAPPRRNGALVFDEPWESRTFGIAIALHDGGALDFEEFRARLVEEIQSWQGAYPGSTEGWDYYERWQEALERALAERGIVTLAEIEARAAAIGHDRAHDHDH